MGGVVAKVMEIIPRLLPLLVPLNYAVKTFTERKSKPPHAPPPAEEAQYPRPQWLPQHTVNWGVTGNTGVGKSALINGTRGVKRNEPHWAPEGVTECTMKPLVFPFPQMDKVRLVDLPGCGTKDHPIATYAEDKGLRWLNGAIIVIRDGRPTENDIYLLKVLQEHNIPFYVVQNRFQNTCESEFVDLDNAAEVNQLAEGIKNHVCMVFREGGVKPHGRVYMVNSRKLAFADGPSFMQQLFQDLIRQADAK